MDLYRVLPPEQALGVAEKLRGIGWAAGKARTKELTGTVKQNGEILDHVLLDEIGKRIINHPEIQMAAIPLKCHKPKFSRYGEGQHYKQHTDAPWMGSTRTDLSCTLWLNDDYEGGDLAINGKAFRGKPGEALVYECGELHEVTPVTSGERICAITWIQSRVRCPRKRRLVSDLRRAMRHMTDQSPAFLETGRVHSALLRMWSES